MVKKVDSDNMLKETSFVSKHEYNVPCQSDVPKAKSQFELLVELSPQPILTLENGWITYINRSGLELLGAHGQMTVVGTPIANYIHPEHQKAVIQELLMLREHGQSASLREQKWLRCDGKTVEVEVFGICLNDIGKGVTQLICHDITEQRKMERSRCDNELRYRKLLQKLPEAIAIHSEGILIYANDAMLRLLCANDDSQLIGRSVFDFIDPRDHEQARKRLANMEHLQSEYINYRMIRLDGVSIDAEITSSEVFQFMDRSVVQTVVRDVTERDKREQFLRQSDKLQAIGQLAAGIAHEIRNPITTLMGFTKLMLQRDTGYGQYSEIIMSELARINEIVSEFLTLSKPQEISYQKHHVDQLLQTIIPIIESQAILSNVDVRLNCRSDVPYIVCDCNQLKQVLINLMKNAIEAMADGGTLTVSTDTDGEFVLIRVRDTGPGIPKHKLSRLGEPYYTTKTNGNGLGIMMCYKIIQAHGGRLHFDSEVGLGTTVTVTLPCESSLVRNKEPTP